VLVVYIKNKLKGVELKEMRVAGIILTTIFEATGLIVWLILSSIFGVVVLFVGLLLCPHIFQM